VVADHIRRSLTNGRRPCGSSERPRACCCCRTRRRSTANEITDKGYINQRLALEAAAAESARMFAATPDDELIVCG